MFHYGCATRARPPGTTVDVRVEGDLARIPPSTDVTAYRIVQEALTNALKHANATRAQVAVCYGAHDIQVEITNDGRGASPSTAPSEGAGTIGMRERVALFGGELQVGPRAHGGYAVRICLPIPAEEDPS